VSTTTPESTRIIFQDFFLSSVFYDCKTARPFSSFGRKLSISDVEKLHKFTHTSGLWTPAATSEKVREVHETDKNQKQRYVRVTWTTNKYWFQKFRDKIKNKMFMQIMHRSLNTQRSTTLVLHCESKNKTPYSCR